MFLYAKTDLWWPLVWQIETNSSPIAELHRKIKWKCLCCKKEKIWGTEYDKYEIIQYVKSVKSKKLASILFFIGMMYEENWMSERTMSKFIPLMYVEFKN